MKTIEEQLWAYIDGDCDPAEREHMEEKIASNPDYKKIYSELMQVHQMITAEQLDEPSMSFTRNVMERVGQEIAPVALKTKVDQRIVYAIAAFFGLSILLIFVYALANSNYTLSSFKMPEMNMNMTLSPAATSLSIKAFLFVDLILALVYFDRLFRKRLEHK
jgi:hypothetical protein